MIADLATLRVISALNTLDIPYMLTGSMATNLYGIPRSTEDADFVVQLDDKKGISNIAQQLGADFVLDRQASFESVTVSQRFLFRVRESEFKIELFLLTDDSFDQQRFQRRQKLQLPDGWVWVPTVEDVVVNKLNWAQISKRSKDFDDACNVASTSGDLIDWNYVSQWCATMETSDLLAKLRASCSR